MMTHLDLVTDMKEGKISRHQVVLNAGGHVKNIDLAAQDVLGFLEVVVSWPRRTLSDLVEPRCEVCWRVGGLCADAVG